MKRLKPWFPVLLILSGLALSQVGCTLLRGGPKTPPVFGTWDFTMDNPTQGTITGTMVIQEEAEGTYSGSVTAPSVGLQDAEMEVESLDIDGPAFTMRATAAGYTFTIQGTVSDDMMAGTNDVSGVAVYTMRATRVVAP